MHTAPAPRGPQRIRELSSWLRPASVGPLVTAALVAIVAVTTDQPDPLFGGSFEGWPSALMIASVYAAAVSACLVGFDIVRTLRGVLPPRGVAAWIGASVAALVPIAIYVLWPPARHDSTLGWALAAGVPIVVGAIVGRGLTWSKRAVRSRAADA